MYLCTSGNEHDDSIWHSAAWIVFWPQWDCPIVPQGESVVVQKNICPNLPNSCQLLICFKHKRYSHLFSKSTLFNLSCRRTQQHVTHDFIISHKTIC